MVLPVHAVQTYFTWRNTLLGNGAQDLLWSVRSMCKLNQIYSVHGACCGAPSVWIVNWAALHVYTVITRYNLYRKWSEENLQLISELLAIRSIGQRTNQHQQMLMKFILRMKYHCYTPSAHKKRLQFQHITLKRMSKFSSFIHPWTTVKALAPDYALSACNQYTVNTISVCHRVENANKKNYHQVLNSISRAKLITGKGISSQALSW